RSVNDLPIPLPSGGQRTTAIEIIVDAASIVIEGVVIARVELIAHGIETVSGPRVVEVVRHASYQGPHGRVGGEGWDRLTGLVRHGEQVYRYRRSTVGRRVGKGQNGLGRS